MLIRKHLPVLLLAFASLAAAPSAPGASSGPGAASAPGSSSRAQEAAADSIPGPVAAALGSIVSVRVHEVVRVPVFRGGRFRREPVEGLGAGSGVIVSEDGLILTNAHVVSGGTRVEIATSDGREMSADILCVDGASDLALLKAAGGRFRPASFAGDVLPAAGSLLYVLGNHGDRGPQIAWARMGAHPRLRVGARPLEFWSEVDAPIGPGNSGGAILDAAGRIVGIPSLLITYTEQTRIDAHAAGLFIPARHARRSLERMRSGPSVRWPWIGALVDDPILAASEGRPWSQGDIRVRRVFPGSPAAEAGLRQGDRIVALGSTAASNIFESLEVVLDLAIGERTRVTVRRDGRDLELTVVPAARPPDPRPDPLDDFAMHTGFRLQPRASGRESRPALALAGMASHTRRDLPEFEAKLFDERPALVSILPGQSALEGKTRRLPVPSLAELGAILARCYVEEQFVALAHWDFGGGKAVDRAHVHRKIYPVVL